MAKPTDLTPTAGLDVSDTVTLKSTLKSSGTAAVVNPLQVRLILRAPSGAETVYTGSSFNATGTGELTYEATLSEPGRWQGAWYWDNGTYAEAEEFYLDVTRNRVGR